MLIISSLSERLHAAPPSTAPLCRTLARLRASLDETVRAERMLQAELDEIDAQLSAGAVTRAHTLPVDHAGELRAHMALLEARDRLLVVAPFVQRCHEPGDVESRLARALARLDSPSIIERRRARARRNLLRLDRAVRETVEEMHSMLEAIHAEEREKTS